MATISRLDPGLIRTLGEVRRRLWLARATRLCVCGLAAGAAAAAAAAFLPIPSSAGRLGIVLGLGVAGPLAALGISLFELPDLAAAARAGDRAAGLDERLTTALELAAASAPGGSGAPHPLAAIQQVETISALRQVDWRTAVPVRVPIRWLAAAALSCALAAGLLVRPVWLSARDAAELAAVTGAVQQFQVALSRSALVNAVTNSDEVRAALSQLFPDLNAARSRADAQAAIARAAARVAGVAARTAAAGREALEPLAGGPLAGLADRLSAALEQQDWPRARQLARSLAEQARQLPNGTEREKQYRQAAASAAAAMSSTMLAAEAVEAAGEVLEETVRELAGMAMLQARVGANPAGAAGEGGLPVPDAAGAGGIQPEGGTEGMAGLPGTTGTGEAGGGQAGGAAVLPDPLAQGPGGTQAFERIYAPERLGEAEGPASQVQGRPGGEDGGTPAGRIPTPAEAAAGQVLRPYTAVLAQYARQAGQTMQRANLDPEVQDLVRQYFAGLEPGGEEGGR